LPACAQAIWCVPWCPHLPSRRGPRSGGWPYAPRARATSRPAQARCRASTSVIVSRSFGETATPTRKERRRFLPMPKGRGVVASHGR
jgi:hypothetical protein